MNKKICKSLKGVGIWDDKTKTCIGKKQFDIDIWEHVQIDNINDELDKVLEDSGLPFGIAVDINYDCLKIDKHGNLKLEAKFSINEEQLNNTS